MQNLERLELPNQLVAVLADPLLQKLSVLRPAAESHRRVANWLGSVLRDFMDGDADEDTLWEVLEVTREYVVQTKVRLFHLVSHTCSVSHGHKVIPPALLEFFARFLELWDGAGRRYLVLDILGYTPLHDFQGQFPLNCFSLAALSFSPSVELQQHIFGPLEAAVLDGSPAAPLSLLDLYAKLLHHWVADLQSADAVPRQASQIVAQLVRHVSRLGLGMLQAAPGLATESAILAFFEQTVRLVADDVLRQYIRIELPPPALVYTLLFSPSLATVSRLCHILACYKRGFEAAMSTKARHDGSERIDALSYDRAYVNRYNGFLMDMCNCFWRARAFSDTDTNARGCMVPRATVSALEVYIGSVDRSTSLASLLSLSHAPILCLQSIRRVREMEQAVMDVDRSALRARHAGPVTQSSLAKLAAAGGVRLSWQEYRIDVLRSLSDKGLPGVTELLKNTMTVLKSSMEGKPGSQGGGSQTQPSQ